VIELHPARLKEQIALQQQAYRRLDDIVRAAFLRSGSLQFSPSEAPTAGGDAVKRPT
jgi:hypothetical protein